MRTIYQELGSIDKALKGIDIQISIPRALFVISNHKTRKARKDTNESGNEVDQWAYKEEAHKEASRALFKKQQRFEALWL